jgi:hypothetical protein
LNADPDIVGKTIRLTGTPHLYAIVGVAASTFPHKAMLAPAVHARDIARSGG